MSSLGSRAPSQCAEGDQVISPVLVESCGDVDRSLVKGVVDMISDVVPVKGQVGGNALRRTYRPHELVNWVKMMNTDALGQETLVIGMGYGDGLQLFAVGTNGEARTILSRRNSSPVKDFCPLPNPPKERNFKNDAFPLQRPLVAICELNAIAILSINTGAIHHSLNHNAVRVEASRCALVAVCQMRIVVLASHDFSLLFELPSNGSVPVALSHRWLAYAEKTLSPTLATQGGLCGDDTLTMTGTVMQAAKTIKSGLSRLGETVTGSCSPPRRTAAHFGQGVVSVVDILAKDCSRTLVHFQAHRDQVARMSFDPAGSLLATADSLGHRFHVFRLHPHPGGSAQARVDHLYVLQRGETTASIWDMFFSLDSRWITVCSARGTLHVFPIAPYGGKATARTHLPKQVVNKLSAYQMTAGVDQDSDSALVVQPLIQIRHNLSNEETELGIRKGDGMLLSMAFSPSRACWLGNNKSVIHSSNQDSLFAVTTTGLLNEYVLTVRSRVIEGASVRPCDDELGIEVTANAVAQWQLLTPNVPTNASAQVQQKNRANTMRKISESSTPQATGCWMSQVEIHTYASPHRRIWMGPQFTFRSLGTKNDNTEYHQNCLVEVASNEKVVEDLAEAMNERRPYAHIHSSADSLYHSPSHSAESMMTFDLEND